MIEKKEILKSGTVRRKGDPPRNVRWVNFPPKLEFDVTTTKFGVKLAYWPNAALLSIFFSHFFRAKSLFLNPLSYCVSDQRLGMGRRGQNVP